jgi:hypothetical protein
MLTKELLGWPVMTRLFGLLGLGACLAIAQGALGPRLAAQPTAPQQGKRDPIYLYCPECGFEMPWHSAEKPAAQLCPRCGRKKQTLQVFGYSHQVESKDAPPTDPVLPTILVSGTLGLALLVSVFSWYKSRGGRRRADPVYHLSCPGCGRRIGYAPSMAGGTGRCPRCKEKFVFPSPGTKLRR